jgi:hypothetical protein
MHLIVEVASMKKPDLLILIAVWQYFIALVIGAGIVIYTLIFPVFIGEGGWGSITGTERMMGGIVGVGIPVLFLLVFFGLALAGGIGLSLPRSREWARIISIINCCFALIFVPIGTVIGILAIIYLNKPEVKEYFK